MTDPVQLMAVGAGLMLTVFVLVMLIVGAVFWFSGREHDRKDAEKATKADGQHKEVIGRFDQMTRNFALIARGQVDLERRVGDSETRLEEHSGRIEELRERLGMKAEL